jgi:hypothetical protein
VYRADEVPEDDGIVPLSVWLEATRGLCRWCGLKHESKKCPDYLEHLNDRR